MKRNLFQSDKKMLNRSSRAMSMLSLKKMDESTVGTLGNWSQQALPQVKKKNETKIIWAYQEDYDYLKDITKTFKLSDDDNSPYNNKKLQVIKILQQLDPIDLADIEERFTFVLKYLKQCKLGNLYNISVLTYSYMLEKQNQYEKAINIWRKFLIFCNLNRGYKYKIIAYKHLAELCLQMNLHKQSINYCKKLVKYSIFFKEYNYELNAYEQIGKILYYCKQTQLAKAFHNKFMEGEPMPENNKIRQAVARMIEYRIRQKQTSGDIDSNSEDDFELDKLVELQELEYYPIRFKEALLKSRHLWGHVRKQSEPLGPLNVLAFDKRIFQKEYFTQLSNNNTIKGYLINTSLGVKKNPLNKIIDKLIIDIQKF